MSRTSIYNKNLSGTKSFTDGQGSLIQSGIVSTNEVDVSGGIIIKNNQITSGINSISFDTTNNNINLGDTITNNLQVNGNIYHGTQQIVFDDTYNFTNFYQNVHVFGVLFVEENGVTYNVGQYIANNSGGGGGSAYPSITYDSATLTTTITGNTAMSTASISNNLTLNGSLLLNSGSLTLTNSNLQKIQYLSNVSSDINTLISAINTKLTEVSWATATPNNITTINNKLQTSVLAFSTTLNGVSPTTFGYISTLSANAQTSITSNTNSITSNSNDIQVLKDTTRNLTATSTQSTFSQTLNSSTFTFNTINGFTSSDFSTAITNSSSLSSSAQSQLTALQNKTQYLTYSTNSSSFSNTLNSSTFVFTNSINGYSTTSFATCIDYCRTLNSDAQNQISAVVATSATALAGSTANSATLAVLTTTTIPAQSALITANTTAIGNAQNDITTLQQKTQNLSYSNATTVTSISGICNLSTLRFTSLDSGFTQITNSPIVIIGTCEHRNGLSITNGFGLSVDGGIVQNNNSGNTFNGNVSCIRDFTTSGTNSNLNSSNIQIGTSTASALTINSTQTNNGDITLVATKKLILKNIVPLNLEDIYFGGSAGAYSNYNVNFNMKAVFNENVNTFSNVTLGSNAFRYPFNSYNDSFTVSANTSVSLTAPIVSIGSALGVTTVYGSLVCGNIYNPTGIVSVLGQALQQF